VRIESRTFRHKAWNAMAAYGIAWFWVTLFVAALQIILQTVGLAMYGMPPLSVSLRWLYAVPSLRNVMETSPELAFAMTVFFAPVVEEALFRMLPLTLVLDKGQDKIRAVSIVVCGILFGMAHGHPFNIFIQGVVGLMLAKLYVKNSSSQLSAYLSCVAVHAAYNLTVLLVGFMNV
jgi:membrane protease YdiL (CAAX protease family)